MGVRTIKLFALNYCLEMLGMDQMELQAQQVLQVPQVSKVFQVRVMVEHVHSVTVILAVLAETVEQVVAVLQQGQVARQQWTFKITVRLVQRRSVAMVAVVLVAVLAETNAQITMAD
jgi:hypothetical protein